MVLPESALGFWTPTLERLWREELKGTEIAVIAGAAVVYAQGYDNVMVMIDASGGRILYRERMPIPVSMWRSVERWTGETGGARASFFGNPVVEVAGRKIAPLICYEQLVLCANLRTGTTMFAKILRIVAKRYGNPDSAEGLLRRFRGRRPCVEHWGV